MNNITTNNATESFGIYLDRDVNWTVSYKNRITSLAKGIVLNTTSASNTGSFFNSFTNDTIVPCSVGCASYYYDVWLQNKSMSTTLLNVSFNKSRVYVKDSNLTVQWYLDINVTNSTNNAGIANAQVIINDSFAKNVFNGTTDAIGGIATQVITEYTQNGTATFNVNTDTCTDLRSNENITCFAPYNISVNITGYGTAARSIDINRSKFVNLSLTISSAVDITPPIVNTTFNISSPVLNDYINFTGNITDETGLLSANITYNISGVITKINFSLSGTTAQVSNATQITTDAGSVINFTMYATDTSNNVRQNSTLITVIENTLPVVNTSLNISSPRIFDVVNLSANITDDTALISANITINFTTGTVKVNFTLSGTTAFVSNASRLPDTCLGGCVVNYTVYATDSSNNVKQNSTVVTVVDNIAPVVNTTFNISSPLVNDVINFTGNVTDETGLLSANITYNMSGVLTKINFSLTGLTVTQVSNATQITTDAGSVINFTMFATDTSNNVRQNSTLITITDNSPVVGICDGGDLQTICWINRTHYVNETDNILSANNVIINGSGKIINSTSISFTINLTGNLTLMNNSLINLSGLSCTTGRCFDGGNLTITAQFINVTGRILVEGGTGVGTVSGHQSGNGGQLIINASSIYVIDNGTISASSDYATKYIGARLKGGDSGNIYINSSLINNTGKILALGGNGGDGYCGSENGGDRGQGGLINITTTSIDNSGLIDVRRGFYYHCEYDFTGRDGQIFINNTWSPCNNGTIFDWNSCKIISRHRIPKDYVWNLTNKNLTLANGASINADGVDCISAVCQSGQNFTIIADVINLSGGSITSDGGAAITDVGSHFSGDGGIININASRIYILSNSSAISASSDYVFGKTGLNIDHGGGNGGTIIINSTFINNTGKISAIGGSGGVGCAAAAAQGQKGDGGLINITSTEIHNTGFINVERGLYGICDVVLRQSGRDGLIYINSTYSPCNNGTIFNWDTCKILSPIRIPNNFTLDLSGKNLTLEKRAKLTGDAPSCDSLACNGGDNFTIIVDVLNLSGGNITSDGGSYESGAGVTSGRGGGITINASKIYISDNSEISASSDFVFTENVDRRGGNGGTIIINATLINSTGKIMAFGGNGRTGACSASARIRGSGGIIKINAVNAILGGLYAPRGQKGSCDNADGGNILINATEQIILTDKVSISGNVSGNLTLIAKEIIVSALINATNSTNDSELFSTSKLNGTIIFQYNVTINISQANLTVAPFLTKENEFGRIKFIDRISNYGTPFDLNKSINITSNLISVNSEGGNLNGSANLTIKGIANNTILRDGVACGDICFYLENGTDTNGLFEKFNVSQFTKYSITSGADTTFPIVNTTFNISSPLVNDVINFTGNITDETGLLSANITYNMSGVITKINFSLSGTTAQASNVTRLDCVETCVINFTMYATDTSNNVKQNSTLLTIADVTLPVVNTTFNTTSPVINDVINFTGNVTDLNGLLSANITYNMSGVLTKINFSLTGLTVAQISNATQITCDAGCVLNFTMYATDTSNNVKQNSTLVSVAERFNFTILVNATARELFFYDRGTLNSTVFNSSIGAIQLNTNGNNGTFLSQVFDIGSAQEWNNISWTTGAHYGSEIGRCVAEDSLITLANGSKKKIKDIKEGEYVQSLDEKTGRIVANRVNELIDMGNKTVFELRTESGRSVNTTSNHPYLVRFGGKTLNPNGVSVNNLPLNSDGLTDLNKLVNDENTVSISGGRILINTMPEYFLGGNNKTLPKCLSKDKITLFSKLASLAISSSSDLKGAFFTSKPSFLSNSTIFSGTFSSEYSFNLLEDDIFFFFNQLRGIVQSRENGFFGKSGEVIFNDSIWCDTSSQQVNYLPDHNSSSLEGRFTMTDFAVNDNILVDFDSHEINNGDVIFKDSENQSDDQMHELKDEIIDINGVKAKWIKVENLSVGDYIAVPDYENCGVESDLNYDENKEKWNGRVVQWIEQVPDSGQDAGSKRLLRESRRAHTVLSNKDINNYKVSASNTKTSNSKVCGIKWEKIERINILDKQQVYDLNIENTHNFIANDIIAHNTYGDSNNPLTSNGLYPNISINTSGLVGLWHFNNESAFGEATLEAGLSNKTVDFSVYVNSERSDSNANNGTFRGGATINKSDYKLGGGAGQFDGSNDFVSTSDIAFGGTSPVSVCASIFPNLIAASDRRIVTQGNEIVLRLNSAAEFILNSFTTNDRATGVIPIPLNQWSHICGTYASGGSISVYVNGILDKAVTPTGTYADDTTIFTIGAMTTAASPFNGQIDEVAIWNRTLSSAEVLNLYKRGALRLNLSVRSCNDDACADETFSEPLDNSTKTRLNKTITPNNRYFQYRASYSSENRTFSPELYNVTIHYGDRTPPVVNTSFNASFNTNVVLNFSANITDETALLSGNITYNISGVLTKINFSLSGTSARIYNVTDTCSSACVINFTAYVTDTSNNVKQNSTLISVRENTLPVVNTSLNISAPRIFDVVNVSANITDETALISANITINFTTGTVKVNFSLSGTTAFVSNASRLPDTCVGGCVVNYTVFATDSSNNVKQNSTLVTVVDNIFPVVNTTFNISSPLVNDVINFTGNVTDETALLSANITYNISGSVTKVNFSLSGTATQVSNVTILPSSPAVINFTMFVTDTSNNVKQNSTLVTISAAVDNIAPVVNTSLNISAPRIFDVVNVSANITDETALISANITINFTTGTVKVNFSLSGTTAFVSNASRLPDTCVGGCVVNYTVYATDSSNNVKQNSTLVTVTGAIGICDGGDLDTTCWINRTHYVNSTDNILSANNVIINGSGSIINNTAINYKINLSGDLKIYNGGLINLSGYSCSSGTCTLGGNITIIANVVNVSGTMASDGGATTGSGIGHYPGTGGTITINASKIYVGTNSLISASSDDLRDSTSGFEGTAGGNINLNATLINITGTIKAVGGNGDKDTCSWGNDQGRKGSGGIVNITTQIIENTGFINVEKGPIGYCDGKALNNDGRDGQIWINNTFSPCNNGTIFDADFSKTCKITKGIRAPNDYVVNLSGKNYTLGPGARLNADGQACGSGTCQSGESFTIIVDVLNLSDGNISSDGGAQLNSGTGLFSGSGGTITINASKIYVGTNSLISASSDDLISSTSQFSGGNGGTVYLNATLINITGAIKAVGGNADTNTCSGGFQQGMIGNGGIVNITAIEISNTGLINVEKGVLGYCDIASSNSGRDGQIWIDDTLSPCNNGTIFDSDFSKTCKITKGIRLSGGYILNLSGKNYTLNSGARLNGDADDCTSGTCQSGESFTIIVDVLNLSDGNISSDGGAQLNSGTGLFSGSGGTITINASKIYVGTNSLISASSDYVINSGSIFNGGNGGTIKLNATLVNISGTINARGGNAENDACGSSEGIRGGGGSIFINSIDAEITQININRGNKGHCNNSNGGFVLINTSNILRITDSISATGNLSGNITLIAKELYINATLNTTNGTETNSGINGTITLQYNVTINISQANITPPPFLTKENEFGRIQFIDRISGYASVDINKSLNISSNLISVNSEGTYLNGSANLTIKDITNNTIFREGAACGAICSYLDFVNSAVIFNVSQFTKYYITTPPVVNTSLNISAPRIFDVVNVSANITDETALISANITINFTTGTVKVNFSLSGTTAFVSNASRLPDTCVGGCVVNYTVFATDSSNNVKQNSTLVTVVDNIAPVVNTTFNVSSPVLNDVINFTGNVTDETALLSANITYNMSGVITKINFSISGTSTTVHNVTKLEGVGGSVINFTIFGTDTSNNVAQNSTLIRITDNVKPVVNTTFNKTTPRLNDVINFTGNISDETALLSANITYNMSGVITKINFTLSGTTAQVSNTTQITTDAGSVINFTMYATDSSNNVKQNSTLITVAAAAVPRINVSNASGFVVDPLAGGYTYIRISFNVTDSDGAATINASTAVINLTLGDAQYYSNSSAAADSDLGTCANHTQGSIVIINCTVALPYYANASSIWAINISVEDINGNIGRNNTQTFTVNTVSGLALGSAFANFSSVLLGQQNVPTNPPLIINNTGNDDFDQLNLTASALIGTVTISQSIEAASFFANITNATAGAGTQLSTSAVIIRELEQPAADSLLNATLVHGHTRAFEPNSDKGNRTVYLWVDVPSTGLSAQFYNATWNVTAVNLP
ncbi:MAG: LamG-like jellyroll fold domain-containing protein [Nanoarchaeota archaeon]